MNTDRQRPILYSFRRCPYAMRARMGLVIADIEVELREIQLRDKPEEMIALSAKATVPLLQLTDGRIVDESLDILYWAIDRSSVNPEVKQLLAAEHLRDVKQLVALNDHQFKANLDRYKYAVRFPEKSVLQYRNDCEVFLEILEERLTNHRYLCSAQMSLADIAIFPFIRQLAGVDRQWFEISPYVKLREWLNRYLESEVFAQVMTKYPLWKENKNIISIFPE